jgi:hypothetical protein
MNIKKLFTTMPITATIIAIVAATITFPNVAVLATPLFEQGGNDTTTTPGATTATGGQQSTIHITKDGTNSYVISGGSSSVGSFDTTYRVVGERSAIRASEDLITSTIIIDFSTSITRAYVMVGNTTTTTAGGGAADGATLPNPFATPLKIT